MAVGSMPSFEIDAIFRTEQPGPDYSHVRPKFLPDFAVWYATPVEAKRTLSDGLPQTARPDLSAALVQAEVVSSQPFLKSVGTAQLGDDMTEEYFAPHRGRRVVSHNERTAEDKTTALAQTPTSIIASDFPHLTPLETSTQYNLAWTPSGLPNESTLKRVGSISWPTNEPREEETKIELEDSPDGIPFFSAADPHISSLSFTRYSR